MNAQRILFRPVVGVWVMLAVLLLAVTMAPNAAAAITRGSTATAYTSLATSLTVGKPASVVPGDFLLAQITFQTQSNPSVTAPTGWTQVRSDPDGIGSAIYWKLAIAGEPDSYAWNFNKSIGANGGIIAYTGVGTTNPIFASSAASGNSGTPTAIGVNARATSMLVAFYSIATQTTLSTPNGMAECYILSPSARSSKAADQTVGAGPTGSRTSTAGASGKWVAQLVDLAPAPVLTLPSNMTVEATSSAGVVVTFTVTGVDAGGATVPVTCAPPSGSTFPLGETTVTCSATDSAGNTANGSFRVTVRDTTPPVLTLPSNMTVEAAAPTGAVLTFNNPTAVDAVDGSRPVACPYPSGSTFPLGETIVNCSASDTRNNTANGSFKVTVVDTTAPILTLPADMTVEATSSAGAVVTFTVTAVDVVNGPVPVTCLPDSGSTFPLGVTTVTCSAKDAAGKTATGSFKVTVGDTTTPVLTLPADMTVEATSSAGAVVTFTATAVDLVNGPVPVTCDPSSGSTFPLGETTVNCSATDGAGKTATGSFKVTVRDTTAPALDLPANIEVSATRLSGAVVTFPATAEDAVDGAVAVTCTPASGSRFPVGTTAVTCSATDARGNRASGSFTVTVTLTLYLHNKPTPPVGDTSSQGNLPMDVAAPQATVLYNYDKDRDAAPGRLIQKGGSATTLNRALYQNWRAVAPNGLTLTGDVELTFYSGMKDFYTVPGQASKRGYVEVFLREVAPSGVITNLGFGSVDRSNWHGDGWMGDTISFTGLNHTIAAGNALEVKIIVNAGSDDDMWFAYDAVGYPAQLIVR